MKKWQGRDLLWYCQHARQHKTLDAGLVMFVERMLDAMFDERELRAQQADGQQERKQKASEAHETIHAFRVSRKRAQSGAMAIDS